MLLGDEAVRARRASPEVVRASVVQAPCRTGRELPAVRPSRLQVAPFFTRLEASLGRAPSGPPWPPQRPRGHLRVGISRWRRCDFFAAGQKSAHGERSTQL